jgi:membrane-associated PAP2 superfamily phosphatase
VSYDAGFWIRHALIPLLFFLPAMWLFEASGLDLWIADQLFRLEGNAWSLRDGWFTYYIMHHWGKRVVLGLGVIILACAIAGNWNKRLRPFRSSLWYLAITITLVPSLIAASKRFSAVPCPWDLQRYGAEFIYHHSLSYPIGLTDVGHCFPSGHSSGGFALVALYFAAWPHFPAHRFWFLAPALLVGFMFGFAQQLRGAHFLSHDLWTAAVCWYGALLVLFIYYVVIPQRKRQFVTARSSPLAFWLRSSQ